MLKVVNMLRWLAHFGTANCIRKLQATTGNGAEPRRQAFIRLAVVDNISTSSSIDLFVPSFQTVSP